MGITMMVIGILFTSVIFASIATILLCVINDLIRVSISIHKSNNSSHQSTTGTYNLTHRDVFIGGINCFNSLVYHWVIGFRDLVTYVHHVSKPRTKQDN